MAGELLQGRGAGGSPKHKQLHFTTWNLHRGPPNSLFAQPHPWHCACLRRCPENSAAPPAPAEPLTRRDPMKSMPRAHCSIHSLLLQSPTAPLTPRDPSAGIPRGRAPADFSYRSWQAGKGGWGSSAVLFSTEQNKKSVISWQIVH